MALTLLGQDESDTNWLSSNNFIEFAFNAPTDWETAPNLRVGLFMWNDAAGEHHAEPAWYGEASVGNQYGVSIAWDGYGGFSN